MVLDHGLKKFLPIALYIMIHVCSSLPLAELFGPTQHKVFTACQNDFRRSSSHDYLPSVALALIYLLTFFQTLSLKLRLDQTCTTALSSFFLTQ